MKKLPALNLTGLLILISTLVLIFVLEGTDRIFPLALFCFFAAYSSIFYAWEGLRAGTIGEGGNFTPVSRANSPIKFWLTFGVSILFGVASTLLAILLFVVGIARLL